MTMFSRPLLPPISPMYRHRARAGRISPAPLAVDPQLPADSASALSADIPSTSMRAIVAPLLSIATIWLVPVPSSTTKNASRRPVAAAIPLASSATPGANDATSGGRWAVERVAGGAEDGGGSTEPPVSPAAPQPASEQITRSAAAALLVI